jgi:hypothetical protein
MNRTISVNAYKTTKTCSSEFSVDRGTEDVIIVRENVFLRVYEEPDHEATEGVHTY